MAKNSKRTVWCIAYINRDHIHTVEEELRKYNYDVVAYIPTVKILKKQFKGKSIFEFVPLLFNYGFFKIRYKDATNSDFLLELRNRITCLVGWVKDPTKTMSRAPRLRTDNADNISGIKAAATATDKEIARLTKESAAMSIYSAEDLSKFKKGDYIKLKGYPFDDMPAEIISINLKKREVRVSLLLEMLVKEVTVSFENVFYTIYQGLDEKSKEDSYDELGDKYGQNTVDKMIYQNYNSNEQ